MHGMVADSYVVADDHGVEIDAKVMVIEGSLALTSTARRAQPKNHRIIDHTTT